MQLDLIRRELGGFGGRDVAVGMLFLPAEPAAATKARRDVAAAVAAHELLAVEWRALASRPRIEQLFVIPRIIMNGDEFEARLARARHDIEDLRVATR